MTDSDLPPEMMETIFAYLTFRERLLVSRTCRLWHELIFCPKFCKRLFLHLRSAKDLAEKPYAREMMARCRNIVILCSDYKDHELELLKDYMNGASLELLHINAAKLSAKRIVETVLAVVPELKKLHLELLGNWDKRTDEVIRIKHQKLTCAVLNGRGRFKIECSNLTELESDQVNEAMLQCICCHQGQLQILKLTGGRSLLHHTAYNVLSNCQWDHLRELRLISSPLSSTDDLERILKQMPYLQKLSLHGSYQNFTGNEVGEATHMLELSLTEYRIDTDSFNKFLSRSSLKRISLLNCTCVSAEILLKSGSIKSLTLQPIYQKLLPLFPRLKILDLQGMDDTDFRQTLLHICEVYPELEHLTLGVKPGQIGTMKPAPDATDVTAKNPFPTLKKLDKLKVLYINRIDLTSIDWTACEGSNVDYIHLKGCSIEGTGAEKLVKAFKHLRTFYLDYCYLRQPRADLFDIDQSCTDGLRRLAPHCKISYYDVHIEELRDYGGRSRDFI